MEGNWIIESLKWVFAFWNEKQTEIWELIDTTLEEFEKGLWQVPHVKGRIVNMAHFLLYFRQADLHMLF